MLMFMDPANLIELPQDVRVPAAAVRFANARSGGPGGQNVNKVNTKVELWVAVDDIQGLTLPAAGRLRRLAGARLTQNDEIHITADTTRSQSLNRQDAVDRLRELILKAQIAPRKRKKTRPTRASRQRRLEAKRRRSQTKSQRRQVEP